ncbi:hypothetical protein U0070_015711, partial [Myodes glareolus]
AFTPPQPHLAPRQPVIPGRQNNLLVSPALDGGPVSVSPGSTEQEEEEGDDLKPANAVQRFKNSLASQVFLEMKSPFLRSVHILFAFEVFLKELAFCFEGYVCIVDRIPEAFEDNKGAMGSFNTSLGGRFILVGFSDWPQLEPIFFIYILIFYSLTLFGNTTIIALSRMDLRLHTPITVPQLLINIEGHDHTITYGRCVAQLFSVLALGSTESMLLVVMAFDRYAAVCRPLLYTTIMHPLLCQALAISSWVAGLVNSLIQTGLMMAMPLCGYRLNHFFCEMPVFLKLACKDTAGTEAKMFVARAIILVFPATLILGSYAHIARAVLKVKSISGRRKAFGTCGSHLLVVSMFYGSTIYTYLQPNDSYSENEGKFVALFYTIITPMLNPLIYTLRNKDVKGALWKVLGRGIES